MSTILLTLDSNSIGDTICFIPCANEFSLIREENVLVKIKPFFINFFKNVYPNINFYTGGEKYDKELKVHYNFNEPMQSGFAKQMGFIKWDYIRPIIDFKPQDRPVKNKFISVGIHSTAQLKYWNNPLGKEFQPISPYWSQLFKQVKKKGYLPVVVEKDEMFGVSPYMNGMPSSCVKKLGLDLFDTMNYIYHSEFFIGLSSGLSWIAHALGKPVVMISNFTEDWHEIDLNTKDYIRITNKSVCHGCWNKVNIDYKFDFSDWYWCPLHKGTSRQFECHTSITPNDVYKEIEHLLI